MQKLNELKEAFYPQYGTPGSRDMDVTARRKVIDENIEAVAEAFRTLEQEVQKNLDGALAWQQRAEAAEAKLAELETQANDQMPFMYGIMTANGDAHFKDFCVSSDPGLLEDVIWEWNNSLADNEQKSRVVALYTHPTLHE